VISIEDRTAILDLFSRFNWALDAGKAEDVAGTFTTNARWKPLSGTTEIVGRTEIEAVVRKLIEGRPATPYRQSQHWVSNFELEGDAGQARGRCYALVVKEERASGTVAIASQSWHEFELLKVDGSWYFDRRASLRDMPT
jgi:uncharacterized protein (TIGR02246 family)